MKTLVLLILSVVTFAFLGPQKIYAADYDKEMQLENSNITLNLVKPVSGGNQLRTCFPDEPISLTSETVQVGNKTINEILHEINIHPDVESYGVIYLLNPGVNKLTPLGVTELKIPKVRGGKSLGLFFADGYRILLTKDKELKEQFGKEVKTLDENIKAVKMLATGKFLDEATRVDMLSGLENVSGVLNGINARFVQRAGRPIPLEILNQLIAMTQIVNTTIKATIPSHLRIGAQELEQIAAVKDDLNTIALVFSETGAGEAPDPYSEVPISVRTFRNGTEIRGLRIYYIVRALKGKLERASSFGNLSPINRNFPVSGYCFWGGTESNTTPITNVQCEAFRTGQGTIQIELVLSN